MKKTQQDSSTRRTPHYKEGHLFDSFNFTKVLSGINPIHESSSKSPKLFRGCHLSVRLGHVLILFRSIDQKCVCWKTALYYFIYPCEHFNAALVFLNYIICLYRILGYYFLTCILHYANNIYIYIKWQLNITKPSNTGNRGLIF